jgi:quercetin dioxygenase-like cupin family protein
MGVTSVRDYAEELEGYAYLPRMFDKARAKLAGNADAPAFGCPLDHTCMARLQLYPETILELVANHGDDDRAILEGLRARGLPPADEAWFDATATEDELLTGVYLRVRPRERLDEIEPREGDVVLAVEQGEAKITLGDRQMRIVRAGEVVRIPPELPHTLERRRSTAGRADRFQLTLTGMSNLIQVVEYGRIQFTKGDPILRGMGLADLSKAVNVTLALPEAVRTSLRSVPPPLVAAVYARARGRPRLRHSLDSAASRTPRTNTRSDRRARRLASRPWALSPG